MLKRFSEEFQKKSQNYILEESLEISGGIIVRIYRGAVEILGAIL